MNKKVHHLPVIGPSLPFTVHCRCSAAVQAQNMTRAIKRSGRSVAGWARSAGAHSNLPSDVRLCEALKLGFDFCETRRRVRM